MRSVSTTQTIAHPANALYQIALDVEKYSEFLPFCRRTRVLESQESAKGLTILCEMEIAFGLLRESYTSEIIAENEPKTPNQSSHRRMRSQAPAVRIAPGSLATQGAPLS